MGRDRMADLRKVRNDDGGGQGSSSGRTLTDRILFRKYKKILAAQGEKPFEETEAGNGDNNVVIHMDGQMYGNPENSFFNMVEEIRGKITLLEKDTRQVKIKQSNIISNPVVDDKDKRELDKLMDKVRNSSNEIKIDLKGIEKKIAEKGDGDSAEHRIRRNQHKHLLMTFKNIVEEYQISQADHRDRCKNRLKRQIDITGANMSDQEIEDMLEEGNFSVFTQSIIMETERARQMLADVEDRHNEIIKLEKTIREVNELFKELAEHVQLQGETIDTIERQVQATSEHVEQGREQLVQAKHKQSSARKKKICIICTLLIIIAIVILIIVFSV